MTLLTHIFSTVSSLFLGLSRSLDKGHSQLKQRLFENLLLGLGEISPSLLLEQPQQVYGLAGSRQISCGFFCFRTPDKAELKQSRIRQAQYRTRESPMEAMLPPRRAGLLAPAEDFRSGQALPQVERRPPWFPLRT